jgi:hypothetical protein
LVPFAEQSQAKRLPYLLDDLQIWRHARAGIQVELDHGSGLLSAR